MTDVCEALLYAAARAQHLHDTVIPNLERGKLVICDRYLDSSYAYQAHARGLGMDYVRKINAFALQYLPDTTIFLDLPPALAFRARAAPIRRTASSSPGALFTSGSTRAISRF